MMIKKRLFNNFTVGVAIVIICLMIVTPRSGLAQAKHVNVYGTTLSQSSAFQQALARIHVQAHKIASLQALDATQTRLLLLASDTAVSSSEQLAISKYLENGGSVIVIDVHNFYGAPQPVHARPIADFAKKDTFTIIKPDGTKSHGEDPAIQHISDSDANPALRLTTLRRDMINIRIQVPVTSVRSSNRTVVTFTAKGDAYMDLLFLEAADSAGQKYVTFVPLSQQWDHYAISLADFIPEGWNDPAKPYPLIDPASVESIALGTHRNTLWQEKPMDWSLGQVNLAEERNNVYAPTAALNTLSIPFKEIGVTAPQWIFNPFYESKESPSFAAAGSKSTFTSNAWICPPAYADFPGTKMGTDNKKEYATRASHSMRRDVLFADSNTGQSVAENRLFTGGIYTGSNVALFGFTPQQIIQQRELLNSLTETIDEILHQPKIAQVDINTTAQDSDRSVVPLVTIMVKSPLDHPVEGELLINVSDGKLHGRTAVALPPHRMLPVTVPLNAVPDDFSFDHFQWQVTLKSSAGIDTWRDTVDAERLVLQAMIHMIKGQNIYPDGRISNHYFADAYGVRAMFAYLRFINDHPEQLQRNPDLWKHLTPQQIRDSAERFADMIVRRQAENGSVPMGYGEQTKSFNVADGGQISLGLGCIAFEEPAPTRHQRYLKASKKIIDFAETFYIDEKRFAEIKNDEAEDVKRYRTQAGFYGLGVYSGGKRRSAGPIWVLSDVMATQALLSYAFPDGPYREILERNVNVYLEHAGPTSGWYQSEAMIWSWLTLPDERTRQRIAQNLQSTFIPTLLKGQADDMHDSGSRGTLRALPLIYYRRYIHDSPSERAALLKYAWSAGSDTSSDSVASLAREYPNPHHGASLAAMKYAQFSSIWAMELLAPNSTLLQMKQFPTAQ